MQTPWLWSFSDLPDVLTDKLTVAPYGVQNAKTLSHLVEYEGATCCLLTSWLTKRGSSRFLLLLLLPTACFSCSSEMLTLPSRPASPWMLCQNQRARTYWSLALMAQIAISFVLAAGGTPTLSCSEQSATIRLRFPSYSSASFQCITILDDTNYPPLLECYLLASKHP